MNPKVYVKSSDKNKILDSILTCISTIDGKAFFSSHIGSSPPEQKTVVSLFQYALLDKLQKEVKSFKWVQEFSPSSSQKDKIDIYGEYNNTCVAIELDKNRADQVAKKFVSRVALLSNKDLYYISLCYPGTEKMNLNECIKYFEYCEIISNKMSVSYAGLAMQLKT